MGRKDFQETSQGCRLKDVELVWARNSKEFFFANSVVVHDSHALIIDPSANFTYFEHLAASGKQVRVLNTHYHTDHRALNTLFKNAHFLCHRDDAPAMRSWKQLKNYLDQSPGSPYLEWVERMWQQMHLHETPVDTELQDNDVIETDSHRLRVIHIPGHTPGLIGLHFEDIDLLFTADIDLTPFGPWYANTVSDVEKFKSSIQKIRAIDVSHYVSSHGQRIYDREKFLEKLAKFEAHFERRDTQILDALKDGPQTVDTLSARGIIYRPSLLRDPLKHYFSIKMIEKHLESFVKANQITQEKDMYLLV
jgi:glyoxylase-like metal-dependent hydrolase (beta-lactamase superfamily II)